MIEVTIVQRNSPLWSSITIARTTALIVTSAGDITQTDTDTAWQLVAYCTTRPQDYIVTGESPS
jgi:hypothetical protein